MIDLRTLNALGIEVSLAESGELEICCGHAIPRKAVLAAIRKDERSIKQSLAYLAQRQRRRFSGGRCDGARHTCDPHKGIVVNFGRADWEAYYVIGADAVFCGLATSRKKARNHASVNRAIDALNLRHGCPIEITEQSTLVAADWYEERGETDSAGAIRDWTRWAKSGSWPWHGYQTLSTEAVEKHLR